jgi:hypothetical protein
MLTSMRTTLVIEDSVLRRAKALAARNGTTLSAIVEGALRDALRESAREDGARFVFPTFGDRARKGRVDHSPADLYAALEADESPDPRSR